MAFFRAISDGNPLARDPWPHHHFRKSSGGLAYGSPGRGTAPGAFEGGTGGIPSPGQQRNPAFLTLDPREDQGEFLRGGQSEPVRAPEFGTENPDIPGRQKSYELL